MDALVVKHGIEAAHNAINLGKVIACSDYEAFRLKTGKLSKCVHVLFLRSDQPPPEVQLPELAVNVEVIPISGMHFAALHQVTHGDLAAVTTARFEAFFQERE